MSLNCNEINKIISETDFTGAFIQEITQTGFDTLGLKIISKGKLYNLLICTSPKSCRINLTQNKFTKNAKPLRFNEFLKSHIQGMRINEFRQIGLDRIIKMDVSTWQEKFFIYIRLWSGAANVIVTQTDGKILDCMFRRPKRGEISGGFFIPEEKILTEEEIQESLKKFPVRDFSDIDFSGFSKFYEQNSGRTSEQNLEQNKEENSKNNSGLNLEQNHKKFENLSFNEKIDFYYSEHAETLSRESLLCQAEKWFNVKHSKMQAALENLLKKQEDFRNANQLKHTGDLILSFAHQINGSSLDCTDYESGKKMHIKINPNLNAQENAALYYEQYKKSLSGMKSLEHDIELSKKAIENLEQEYKSLVSQKNVLKLEQMLRRDTSPTQKNVKNYPGLHYEIDGWTILVGRNASENDELLRHNVKGNDMWLHTRDYAGGYVFIKAKNGKSFPLEILLYAGNLAVYHSKARKNGQADLYYTQVKYLKRAKNGPKGLVLPSHEKNLLVKLDSKILNKFDELEAENRL